MDAVRGARHPALLGRGVDRPDVEVGPALPERRSGEEELGEALRVGVPLPHLGGGVPVAEEEEVHLLGGRAVLHDRPGPARGRGGPVDRRAPRVDRRRPGLAEETVRAALLHHDLHRAPRLGEAERLVERAVPALRLVGRLPLAADARETARVDRAVRGLVDHLEEVLAEVRVVDRARGVPGPEALEHDAVEGEAFLGGTRGVEIVEAQRAGRLGGGEAATAAANRRDGSMAAPRGSDETTKAAGLEAARPGVVASGVPGGPSMMARPALALSARSPSPPGVAPSPRPGRSPPAPATAWSSPRTRSPRRWGWRCSWPGATRWTRRSRPPSPSPWCTPPRATWAGAASSSCGRRTARRRSTTSASRPRPRRPRRCS